MIAAYSQLEFPIPTPAYDVHLGAALSDISDLRVMRSGPMTPVRSFAAAPGQTGASVTYVPVSGGMLNLNTGEIVDGETAQNVSQAATVNPSILTAPAANLPPQVASKAVQSQVQSGTLPTAASTGIIAGATNWFSGTTMIGSYAVPNAAVAVVGGLLLLSLLGGKKGRR